MRSERELIGEFVEKHSESAFEEIVRRHGKMVAAVCYSVLEDRALAEDATQATFLVLAKKARKRESRLYPLCAWLHHVAMCVARNARKSEMRRRRREKLAMAGFEAGSDGQDSMLAQIHEQLGRMQQKHRVPILLHHIEGLSYEDAAQQMGITSKNFSARLTRSRELLRKRLSRTAGIAVGAALMLLSETVNAAVVNPCNIATAATAFAIGNRTAVTANAIAMAQGGLKAMIYAKMKLIGIGASACLLLGGVGVICHANAQGNDPSAGMPPSAPSAQPEVGTRINAPVAPSTEDVEKKTKNLPEAKVRKRNAEATRVAREWFISLMQGKTAVTTSLSGVPFSFDRKFEVKTAAELKKIYAGIVKKKGVRNLKPASLEILSSSPNRVEVRLIIGDEGVRVTVKPGKTFRVVGFSD